MFDQTVRCTPVGGHLLRGAVRDEVGGRGRVTCEGAGDRPDFLHRQIFSETNGTSKSRTKRKRETYTRVEAVFVSFPELLSTSVYEPSKKTKKSTRFVLWVPLPGHQKLTSGIF